MCKNISGCDVRDVKMSTYVLEDLSSGHDAL
jgi:hypothetical protein